MKIPFVFYVAIRPWLRVRLVFTVLAAGFAHAAMAPHLNQKALHLLYQEAEFEKLRDSLTLFENQHPRHSREDSLFIERHLSVIYAANPATREKGKYHMYRLLDLDPRATLVDMIISDEIDGIFAKIKEEYAATHPGLGLGKSAPSLDTADKLNAVSTHPVSSSGSTRGTAMHGEPSGSKAWLWWTVSGVGVVAASSVFYYKLSENKTKTDPDVFVVVPEKTVGP